MLVLLSAKQTDMEQFFSFFLSFFLSKSFPTVIHKTCSYSCVSIILSHNWDKCWQCTVFVIIMWIYLHEIFHPSFSSVEDITWAAFSQKWKCLAACALAFLTRYFWSRSLGTPRPDKTLLSTEGTQRDVSITQTGHRPTIPQAAQILVQKKKQFIGQHIAMPNHSSFL